MSKRIAGKRPIETGSWRQKNRHQHTFISRSAPMERDDDVRQPAPPPSVPKASTDGRGDAR
jgi:hypothetical protein